ncbi:hypothetical protein ACFLWA_10860 [Chloroflexota bacterium]
MKTARESLADPYPDAQWQVWYQDNFDRECPRQIEVAGQGLAEGLCELWTRHLRETVLADGQRGFSRFNLWWEQESESIEIAGEWGGMIRLREWIFGPAQRADEGQVADGGRGLLGRVAVTHCYLIVAGKTSEEILAAAMDSDGLKDFGQRLMTMAQAAAAKAC